MDKACIQIKTKEDERRWKEFLSTYFPNNYSKRILEEDLLKYCCLDTLAMVKILRKIKEQLE